jgi:hypothetical protein
MCFIRRSATWNGRQLPFSKPVRCLLAIFSCCRRLCTPGFTSVIFAVYFRIHRKILEWRNGIFQVVSRWRKGLKRNTVAKSSWSENFLISRLLRFCSVWVWRHWRLVYFVRLAFSSKKFLHIFQASLSFPTEKDLTPHHRISMATVNRVVIFVITFGYVQALRTPSPPSPSPLCFGSP